MLSQDIIKQIQDFVYKQPRSIQEIAEHIDKNWRTADRYISEIQENFGTISIKVFRGGTRGALKIVYWASIEKVSFSVFQEQLEKQLMQGRTKYEFSAFDIFQHVPEKDKTAWIKKGVDESDAGRLGEFRDILRKAEKQIIFFSGNLSFINFKDENTDIFNILEQLVKKGISIKVICRVDISGLKNIEKLLSLNFKYGKELIQIHHKQQPLRATIIDNKILNLKETKQPSERKEELEKKAFIFYTIKNKDWIEWLTKIFWKMFSSSIDSTKRIKEMQRIIS